MTCVGGLGSITAKKGEQRNGDAMSKALYKASKLTDQQYRCAREQARGLRCTEIVKLGVCNKQSYYRFQKIDGYKEEVERIRRILEGVEGPDDVEERAMKIISGYAEDAAAILGILLETANDKQKADIARDILDRVGIRKGSDGYVSQPVIQIEAGTVNFLKAEGERLGQSASPVLKVSGSRKQVPEPEPVEAEVVEAEEPSELVEHIGRITEET